MTECQRCGGKASDAFLCRPCIQNLQRLLAEMPWWLARLDEAARGDTRMADNGGRRSARRKDLDGDTELAACIEQLPEKADDLDKARKARQQSALAHALATGGINAHATRLLEEVADSITYWCRTVANTSGATVDTPALATQRLTAIAAVHSAWMAANTQLIANTDDADTIYGDIETHIEDITKAVNRPIPTRQLGPCPSFIHDETGHIETVCGRPLYAPADQLEVYCRRCKTIHPVHRLQLARFDEAQRKPMTFETLCKVNKMQDAGWQIPLRTLQHWRQLGAKTAGMQGLPVVGYENGEALYRWDDVRRLRIAKPQKELTGAAAHTRDGS